MAAPRLAKAYALGDHRRLQQVASFSAAVSGLAAVLGGIILVAFGRELLAFMNPAFATSYAILLVVMGGFVVSALCGSSGYLMTMTGHEGQFLRILAVCNGLGLVALVILTWGFGGMGAAWGLFASTASWNLVVVILARRQLRIDPSAVGILFPPKSAAA
jgi:O-antigen/teichoic acid export membrane protein